MDTYKLLEHLKLSRDESRTFDAILPHPDGITVVALAKKLNKPRATLYDHLKELAKIGLVKKSRTDEGSVFYPEDEKTIRGIFEENSHTVARAGLLMERHLRTLPQATAYNPRLSVIDSSNAAKIIFQDVLRSQVKESYWFWPVKALLHTAVPDEVFAYWHKERIKQGMKIKVLWPHKQKVSMKENEILGSGKDQESLRQIRILPGPVDATMGYGIYGNKVGFISSARENYGFIVDSKEFSETLKSQFDFFWNISKKR